MEKSERASTRVSAAFSVVAKDFRACSLINFVLNAFRDM